MRWYVATVAVGPVAHGEVSDFGSATEAAHAIKATLEVVADCLQAWAKGAGASDERTGHAEVIASRLRVEAAAIGRVDDEAGYAVILADPRLASVLLNTLLLPHDMPAAPSAPIPFGPRWGGQPVRLLTWTAYLFPQRPRPVRAVRPRVHRGTTTLEGEQMNVVELHPAGGAPPAPGSPGSVRRWLTDAITTAVDAGCSDCAPRRPCPPHAADGVIDACRGEKLFIMPTTDADAIIEMAVGRRLDSLAQGRQET